MAFLLILLNNFFKLIKKKRESLFQSVFVLEFESAFFCVVLFSFCVVFLVAFLLFEVYFRNKRKIYIFITKK